MTRLVHDAISGKSYVLDNYPLSAERFQEPDNIFLDVNRSRQLKSKPGPSVDAIDGSKLFILVFRARAAPADIMELRRLDEESDR